MVWNLVLALIAQFLTLAQTPGAALPAAALVDSISVTAFGPHRPGFGVRFGDLDSDYSVMAMFALPGETVPIQAVATGPASVFTCVAETGAVAANGANQWTWKAPARPGLYPIHVRDRIQGRDMTLNVFVMVPYMAMRRGFVNGYRIGAYPNPRPGHELEYQRPLGFVEVTPAMLGVQVSPHFRLGQFVCKQTGGAPQYLVLRQPLLVKLERLLASVNDRGVDARTFAVMSAYRTPFYNAAIGNVTTFSRHAYGDAADVFVDDDGDGIMDDLNRDGRHTIADARLLGRIVDDLDADLTPGGLGTYGPTGEHGPFVHVDVRGFAVQWGG